MFCLYSEYLLVSNEGDGDARIFSIIEQLEAGAYPFPLILAETLVGLDSFKSGDSPNLKGSPLLLQV